MEESWKELCCCVELFPTSYCEPAETLLLDMGCATRKGMEGVKDIMFHKLIYLRDDEVSALEAEIPFQGDPRAV